MPRKRGQLRRFSSSVDMETIQEAGEWTGLDWNHPLLEKKVLKRLFGYLSVSELKTARLVCLSWREFATPLFRDRSMVTLKGTCDLCKSEWKLNKRTVEPHDHRETISLYRFVTQLHLLTPRGRELIFFRHFRLRSLNLYLIGRVNTEPTRYFMAFVKMFGAKVYSLWLDNVQLCPSESLYTIVPMFPNLDVVKMSNVSVWQDPLNNVSTTEATQASIPVPLRPSINHFVRSLSICKDSIFDESVAWDRIFLQCPDLQELILQDIKAADISDCLDFICTLTKTQLQMLRIRKMMVEPRTSVQDDLEDRSKRIIPSKKDDKESEPKREWTTVIQQVLQLVPLHDLILRLPYSEESYDVIQALMSCTDSLSTLTLHRKPLALFSESEISFRKRPWEIREENWMMLPFVSKLEVAHNLVESLEDIHHVFPGLSSLRVNVVWTEIRDEAKAYHTYLHTNLILSLKNASALPQLRHLVWNVEAARHPKTGKRTVVYKSTAVKHFPRLFPGLVSLSFSVSSASELQVIFRELPGLQQLTLLRNSLYRVQDEDICGWKKSEAPPEGETETEGTIKREEVNLGIKQLTRLTRLSLENNNGCLTDRSIAKGFILLEQLHSLHIQHGKKLTLRGLRLLNRCPYLVYVNITDANLTEPPEEVEVPEYYDMTNPIVRDKLGLISRHAFNPDVKTKIPIRVKPGGRPKRIRRRLLPRVRGRETLPILVQEKTKDAKQAEKKTVTLEDVVLPPLAHDVMEPTGSVKEMLRMSEHEYGLHQLEEQYKKRQAKRVLVFRDGHYEMGRFYKIGGKRYDFVHTTYKVNGRMYQLVRRNYERDTEDEKEYADIKRSRHEKEYNRKMAHLQQLEQEGDPEASDTEDGDEALSNDSESEYERSIKDYDEDDEFEEYCDEEDEREVIYFTKRAPRDSASEDTSEEEGIGLDPDDSMYEGDKELYDSTPPEEEDDEDESSAREDESDDSSETSGDKGFVSETNLEKPTAGKESAGKEKQKSRKPSGKTTNGPFVKVEAPKAVKPKQPPKTQPKKLRFFEELEQEELSTSFESLLQTSKSSSAPSRRIEPFPNERRIHSHREFGITSYHEHHELPTVCIDETITKYRKQYHVSFPSVYTEPPIIAPKKIHENFTSELFTLPSISIHSPSIHSPALDNGSICSDSEATWNETWRESLNKIVSYTKESQVHSPFIHALTDSFDESSTNPCMRIQRRLPDNMSFDTVDEMSWE